VRTAEVELAKRAAHTYLVVTAVDGEGRESACSEYVVWPKIHQVRRGLIRPVGVGYGPDGTKYVVDNHMGALFSVDPEGSLHNYADTALIGSGRVHGVAVDSKNRVLCVGWDNRGVIVIDPEKARIVDSFGGSKEPTNEPGKIYRAFGIAVDGDDRIYVSDRGNKRVQVLEPDGTHLATFAGFPDGPVGEQITGIAARSEGELVRVALVDQGAKGVWLLNFDPRRKTFSATRCIKTRRLPIGVGFGPEGNVYVGTQLGVDVYDPTGDTLLSHWQSEYNPRGHQVWGLAVWKDGTMICSEGGGNEKRWYFALPEEFERVAE
jgi:DNA-binding beta-propeller fold protein YncE